MLLITRRHVEGRTTCCERNDVIDGEVGSGVGVALVARAPIAMLTTPSAEHSRAEALPGPRAVQGVVAAAVRLAGVLGAATAGSAGDHAADRAELVHGASASAQRREPAHVQ